MAIIGPYTERKGYKKGLKRITKMIKKVSHFTSLQSTEAYFFEAFQYPGITGQNCPLYRGKLTTKERVCNPILSSIQIFLQQTPLKANE